MPCVVLVKAAEEEEERVRQMGLVFGLLVMGRRNADALLELWTTAAARAGVGKEARSSRSMAMTTMIMLRGRRSLLQDM